MFIYRIWLSLALLGSISFGIWGCSSGDEQSEETSPNTKPIQVAVPPVDLSPVISMRIEGRTEEAIEHLRNLIDKHPSSVEVMIQLARCLMDTQQFSLAAFRFEQAMSLNPDNLLAKEVAEAHYLARDFDSAIERYAQYLSTQPDDPPAQLRYARMLADQDRATEALNAFAKASANASADDCLIMGNLFLQKNLLSQAKHWYGESSRRTESSPTEPLLGLLRVAKAENNEGDAETIILALEKSASGALESTNLSNFSANLLRKRRLADFIARGMDARGKSVTQLASSLLAGSPPLFRKESIVTSQSKLPPPRNPDASSSAFGTTSENEPIQPTPVEETIDPPKTQAMSLADAFAAPVGQTGDASGAIDSSLNKGQNAYLEGGYTSALLHARDALKKNPEDPAAWRLCSQAHFQLGETNEAEMTILEAIRHQPFDLDMRMDYLRIARETLPSKRYLQELEKVRDLFPESTEILWELARRYQMVENMPVTAAILYRKIIQIAPVSSAIAGQAEIELIKLKDL